VGLLIRSGLRIPGRTGVIWLYGGKAAVVVDDFSRWFIGLWHGKSLAFTVAVISIFISLVFFFAANRLPSRLKSDAHSENNRE
jgi:hypothetical protein